jgi:hypothetical protein
LLEVGLLVDDVDEVVYHPAFTSHDQIEIAQAHVEIDNYRFMATQRKAGSNGGAGSSFTHAAFS